MLVRANEVTDEPAADALTAYDPSTSLGSARELAWPSAMTTEEVDNSAAAPFAAGLATKVTTPPSTGSTDCWPSRLLRAGCKRGAVVRRLRGAAGDGCDGEALALEGADIDDAVDDAWQAALVGCDACGNNRVAAGIDRRAAGDQGIVSVGPP